MKTELALIAILALTGMTLFFQGNDATTITADSDNQVVKAYVQWKSQYGQNTNGEEDQYRFAIFKENFEFVEQHNAKNTNVELQMTEFAALSNEEYRATKLTEILPSEKIYTQTESVEAGDLPASVDWVAKGAVTPIVNQGACGSCWAFSAITSLESLRQIKTGTLEPLSQQQLTSCVPAPFSLGCGGGNLYFAFSYTQLKGVETSQSYPYVQQTSDKTAACEYNKDKVVFQNSGQGAVKAQDPTAMKQQLTVQPLSVAIDAGSIFFQLYKNGVLSNENCGTALNHAVAVVAYDTTGDQPFWTVKNSWGNTWGNKGFVNMLISEGDGVCGINMDVSYPTYK